MDRKTARKHAAPASEQTQRFTRWIPRQLEQLEDRLVPAISISNSPIWVDAGPHQVSGGQVSNIAAGNVIGAISAVAPDLTDLTGNTLYAGGSNGGMWRTFNALAASPTWVPLTDSFPSLSISTISINPDNNRQIIAGVGGSADGRYAIEATSGAEIVLDSRGQARGDLIGALYSEDGGDTWRVLNSSIGGQNVVGVAVRNTYMLVATDIGLYRSIDNGANFALVIAGLPTGGVFDLAADPGAPTDVISGATFSAGVARITLTTPTTLTVGQSVIVTGVNSTGGSPGFNGTFTVASVSADMLSFTYNLAVDPGTYISGGSSTANPNADPLARNRFYVALRATNGVGGQGVYRSDNGGQTWNVVTSSLMEIGANTVNVQISVFNSGIITNNIVYVAVQNNNPLEVQQINSQNGTTRFDYAFSNRFAQTSTITWSPNQGGTWTRMDAPRTVTDVRQALPPTPGGPPAVRTEGGFVTVSTGGPLVGGVRHHLRDGDVVVIAGVADQGNGGSIPRGTIIGTNNAGQDMVNGVWYIDVVDQWTFRLLQSARDRGPRSPNIATFVAADRGGPPVTGVFLLDGAGNPIRFNGGTWAQLLGPGAGERPEFFDITVDPNSSSTIYLGTDRADAPFFADPSLGYNTYTGTYWRGNRLNNPSGFGNTEVSSNQWVTLVNTGTANASAPPADTRDLIVGANGQLIAATGGGLYRLTNPAGAGTWNSMNGDLGVNQTFSVAYDTLNDRLFSATIDTQAVNQTDIGGAAYTSVFSAAALANGFWDQANSFRVLADNNRIDNTGATVNQTVRYYVGTNFGQVLRQTFDANNLPALPTLLNFASPLNTDATFAGLTRDPQGPTALENVHIAMALNQIDPRRAIFGYNGLYEDADPSGSTPTGAIVNDVTPLGMTGHVEQLLYGGRRGGINFNQIVYMTTSTGQLWVRGEFGPTFTDISVNTGLAGPVYAVAGDPDDYRHIYVAQGNSILESRDFGQSFTDITDNLIGPETANGTAGAGVLTTEIRSLAIFDSNPGAATLGDITLLAGGRGGVFRLSNDPLCADTSWSEFGQDLPNTVVNDLQIYNNQRLIAGTAGRGIWMIDDVSGTVVNGVTLTVTGTAAGETISVTLDPSNPSAILVNDGSGGPSQSFTRGTFTRLEINALGGADTVIIGGGDLGFVNFDIVINGGGNAGDTLVVDDSDIGADIRVTIQSNSIGDGVGDTIFVGCGDISFTGFDAGTVGVTTGFGNDTIILAGVTPGTTAVEGGEGSDTFTFAMNPASTSNVIITDGGLAGSDRLNLTGTAANDAFTISPGFVALGANGVGYSPAIEVLTVSGALGNDTFTINGVGSASSVFNGDGGNDSFTLISELGSAGRTVTVNGGTGIDTYSAVGIAGNESVGVDITAAVGNGFFTGLRQSSSFTSVETVGFNGGGGTNNFAWRDRTNVGYGTPTAPQSGVVYTPTGAASGTVRVGTGSAFPSVVFANVNGAFVADGDAADAGGVRTGDQDVLTVLGYSTNGLGSGTPFNESTSANGSDTITVTDQFVTITNATVGALRTISFGAYTNGTPTFRMINVRGGNEAVTGDRFTATPSLRTNIVLNGMNPTAGSVGDSLTIVSSGGTVGSRTTDPAFGPAQTRVVQSSDGASLGYLNIEQVGVFDTTGGGGGGGVGGIGGTVNANGIYVAASDAGVASLVQVFDRITGAVLATFSPFGGFAGGLRVATGDVDGDGAVDVVVSAGPGAGPHVKIYSGVNFTEIASFFAYGPFLGGVEVAVGDLNGDGFAEVITGTGPGAGPHIKVFAGSDTFNFAETASYYAFDPGFLGGIRVAVGDTNGDGTPDLVVGAQQGAEPRVTVFNGKDNTVLQNFFAYEEDFRGGVFVAVGDTDGDGFGDIIIGRGTGGTSQVTVVSGRDGSLLASFQANEQFQDVTGTVPLDGGVRVAAVDIDNDGFDDIMTAKGRGTFPILRFFKLGVGNVSYVGGIQAFALIPGYANGVYVGG